MVYLAGEVFLLVYIWSLVADQQRLMSVQDRMVIRDLCSICIGLYLEFCGESAATDECAGQECVT